MLPTRTACSISLAATLLLVACTGAGPVNPTVAPAATVTPAADPLLDRIIATADGRPLQPTELYERMAQADVVYLAEKHDNPRHHALQLEALRTLLEAGKRPALGFEFFAREQTGYLQDFVQPQNSHGKPLSPAQAEQKLRRELGWGPQRDAEWAFYFPLLQVAKEHQLAVFGADLPDSLKRRISRLGQDKLSPVEQNLLSDSGFNDPAYRALMEQTLIDAHCGWNDPELIDHLYQTWLARNDAMAQSITAMAQAGTGQPVLVILGAGHTRHNMGVVERVQHLWPQARQLNLGYQELAREPQPAAAYYDKVVVQNREFAPAFEYFWFTPRVSFEDPCEQFKSQLQKHSSSAPN